MAKSHKYVGGVDSLRLEAGGKVYYPGDMVPISDELAAHMARNGVIWEDMELPSTGAGMTAELPKDFAKP